MNRRHTYEIRVAWTGNLGKGSSAYKDYARNYDIVCNGKPVIKGSADPGYLGDATRHNPEDMLMASLSACHMLWKLHLCTMSKVVVTAYEDHAEGVMELNPDGSGQFVRVTLRPRVTITAESDAAAAERLHERANAMCFIARSVNFPIIHEPETAESDMKPR